MWNTGSTYSLSSGMAVAGEWGSWGDSLDAWGMLPLALTPPFLGVGMPTAYDLSSVIAGGSSVGHNNLIPLGECPLWSGEWPGWTPPWAGKGVAGPLINAWSSGTTVASQHLFLLLGLLAEALSSSLPCSVPCICPSHAALP